MIGRRRLRSTFPRHAPARVYGSTCVRWRANADAYLRAWANRCGWRRGERVSARRNAEAIALARTRQLPIGGTRDDTVYVTLDDARAATGECAE